MMKETKIWSVDVVQEVIDRFKNNYGGNLSIYKGRSAADANEKISDLGGKTTSISCEDTDTTGHFIEECLNKANLTVKVRTSDDWVVVPDNVPLGMIRHLPKQATKASIEKFVAEFDKERKERVAQIKSATSLYDKMFPLFKITPLKTTLKEIEKMGYTVKSDDSKSSVVRINNIALWDHDGKKTISSYYMTNRAPMPDEWKDYLGFSWSLSYNQWVSLLKRLGCEIHVNREPARISYKGSWTLNAEITATPPDKRMTLNFDFQEQKLSSTGSMLDSPATLYSISIRIK